MADASTIVEGPVKIKEGRKWKSRWCVIRKLSPAADSLHIAIHKDAIQSKNKGIFPCHEFFTFQRGERVEKERYVIAVTCSQQVVLIAFANKSMMLDWEDGIRTSLGRDNVHEFSVVLVGVPPNNKIPPGPATLHIQSQRLCLTSLFPPKFYGAWNVWDIRKYGVQKDKFIFEAGPRSSAAGVYILSSLYCDEINSLVNKCATSEKTWQDPQPGLRQVTRRARLREQLEKVRPISMTASVKDFTNTQVNADVNFRSNDLLESSDSHALTSIENIAKERLMSQCDVPKRRSRSLDTKDSDNIEESKLQPPAKLPPKPKPALLPLLGSSASVPMGLSARGCSPSPNRNCSSCSCRGGAGEMVVSGKNVTSVDSSGKGKAGDQDQSWADDVLRAVNLDREDDQLGKVTGSNCEKSVPSNDNENPVGGVFPVFQPHYKEEEPPPLPPKVNSVQKSGADSDAPHDYINLKGNQDLSTLNKTTQLNAKPIGSNPPTPGPKPDSQCSTYMVPNHPRSNSDCSDQKSAGNLRPNMSVPNMRQMETKSFKGSMRLEEIDLRCFDDREENYMYNVKISENSLMICSDTNIAKPKPQKPMTHSYINLPPPLKKPVVPPRPPSPISSPTCAPSPTSRKVHVYQNVPAPPPMPEKPDLQSVATAAPLASVPSDVSDKSEKPVQEKRHSYVNLPPADSDVPIADYLDMKGSPESGKTSRRPSDLVIKPLVESGETRHRPSSPLEYIDMKGVDSPTSPDYLDMGNGSESSMLLPPGTNSASLDYVPMKSPVAKEPSEECPKAEDYLLMKSTETPAQEIPRVPSAASFKKLRKLSDNSDSGSSSQMSLLSRDLYADDAESNNYINVPEDESLLKRQSMSSISNASTWTTESSSQVQARGRIGRSQSLCVSGSSPKRHTLTQYYSMEGELDDEYNSRPLSSVWKKPPSPGLMTKGTIDSREDRKENIPNKSREPFNNLQPHMHYSPKIKGKLTRPLSTSGVESPSPRSSGKTSFFSRFIRRSTKEKKKSKSQEDILDSDKNDWVLIETPPNAPQPLVPTLQAVQVRHHPERSASVPIRHVQTSPTSLSSASGANHAFESDIGSRLSSSAEHQYHYIDMPGTTPPKSDNRVEPHNDQDEKSITDSTSRLGGLGTLPEESRFVEVVLVPTKKPSPKATPTSSRTRASSQPIPINTPFAPPPLPPRKISAPVPVEGLPPHVVTSTQQQTTPVHSDYAPIWKARSYILPTKGNDSTKSGDAVENTSKSDKIGSTAEVTDCIDNLSLSSHSSDTTSLRGEDIQKASPAASILRPRSGKEYLKVDRKRFTEDNSQPEPRTPTSPTGVFTFEDTIMNSESPSRNCYSGSRGNHSPKSPDSTTSSEGRPIPPRIGDPNYVGVRDRERAYMNMDMTPPGTPPNSVYSVSPQPLEQTNPYLNYAELDLSPGNKHRPYVTPQRTQKEPEPIHSRPLSAQLNYADLDLVQSSKDNKKKVRKTVQRASSIEYAQIDMVSTKALSKTGKEHAIYREDPPVSSLKRSESKKTSSPLLSGSRKPTAGFFRDRKGSTSANS